MDLHAMSVSPPGAGGASSPAAFPPRSADSNCSSPSMMEGMLGAAPSVVGPPGNASDILAMPCARQGASARSVVATFLCSQCGKTLPISMGFAKGAQMWCFKDNASYNALQVRWTKVAALKQWWKSLSPEQKRAWFNKWQVMSGKRNFDEILYSESQTTGADDMLDVIDRWLPWSAYLREGLMRPGATEMQLQLEFQEAVNNRRHQCKFVLGEWCVPVFAGLERRQRARTSVEATTSRQATGIDDVHRLQQLQASGQQAIERFQSQATDTLTLSAPVSAPTVQARPEDQPVLPSVRNTMFEDISREAGNISRDVATRRAMEAAEALEASGVARAGAGKGSEGKGGGRAAPLGLEKTKLENAVRMTRAKLSEVVKTVSDQADEVIGRVDKLFPADGSGNRDGSVGETVQDVRAAKETALALFNEGGECKRIVDEFAGSAEGVHSVLEIRAVLARAAAVHKAIKTENGVKAFFALVGRTKKWLAVQEREKGRQARAAGEASEVSSEPKAPLTGILENFANMFPDACSNSIYEAKAGVKMASVAVASGKDPHEALRTNAMIKRHIKDCESHMKQTGQKWAAKTMEDTGAPGKRVRKIMKEGWDSMLLTTMVLPQLDWAKKLYAPQTLKYKAGFSNVLSTFNCCSEVSAVLSGRMVVVSMPISGIPGSTLKDKRHLLHMSPFDSLKQVYESTGGCCKVASKDDTLLIPSGHLVLKAALEESVAYSWAVAGDEADHQRVKSALEALMVSYPDMRAPAHGLSQFLEFLSDQA
mmetsp:Transcript_91675/g.238956  ORF Transcript_91675/g.238956 Transcript_91675/m.238956 type:complete len:766 (-) Transcript_91675:142-2439(-)